MRSKRPKPEEGALSKAVRLLARREHSRREIQAKLSQRGVDAEEAAPVLDRLEAAGLLSDARYCEAYVNSRRDRGYGPVRIVAELRAKGVAADLIESLVDERHPSWQEVAHAVYHKRYKTGIADNQDYARRLRFLVQRGFPADLARRVTKHADVTYD